MANTYYDSDLTGEQIEQALEAIDGVIDPANNGKVLAINNGKIEARSVQWDADLGPKSITENGTYNPASDNLDGYSQVTVNVSGITDANDVTYDSSETYDSGTVGAALNEQRNTLNQLETETAQLDQNMAYVESGNTASRTYTAGQFISWKGTLYTASTAIPLGDPFAVGTNLAAVVDGNGVLCGGLNSLKTAQETVSFGAITFVPGKINTASQGNITVYKRGNTVTLTSTGMSLDDDTSWSTIMVLPEGYRPATTLYVPTVANNALGNLVVDPNGNVSVFSSGANVPYYYTVTY